MTLFSGLFRRPREGERAIQTNQLWGAGAGDELLPAYNPSGISVDRTSALQLSAVWACTTLIADSISTLPVDTFTRQAGTRRPFRPRPMWLDEPNPEQEAPQWVAQQLMSLLYDGMAYVYTVRDNRGDVVEAWNVPAWLVTPKRPKRGVLVYEVNDPEIGFNITLDRSQMFHIPGISWPGELKGISPLEAARTMIGTGLGAQETAARFYSQGMTHRGIVEVPDDMTPEQAKDLKNDFKKMSGVRKAHYPPVLTGGAKWHEMTVTPEQAQFLESRSFSVSEICRFFRVPPHMVADVEKDSSWGTGIEQQGIGFVTYTLRPWIERLERAYTRSLLLFQPKVFTKFNVNGLMRGDFKARMDAYGAGRQWGIFSADDIRALEDMTPLPDGTGQIYLEPENMRPAGAYEPPSATPTPTGGTANG